MNINNFEINTVMRQRLEEVKDQIKSLIRSHPKGRVTFNQLKADLKKYEGVDFEVFIRYYFGNECTLLDVMKIWQDELKLIYRGNSIFIEVIHPDHIQTMNQKLDMIPTKEVYDDNVFAEIKPPGRYSLFTDSSCESLYDINNSDNYLFKNQAEREMDINRWRDALFNNFEPSPSNCKQTVTLSQLPAESLLNSKNLHDNSFKDREISSHSINDVIKSKENINSVRSLRENCSQVSNKDKHGNKGELKELLDELILTEDKQNYQMMPPVQESSSFSRNNEKNLQKLKKFFGELVYAKENQEICRNLRSFVLLLVSDGISVEDFQNNIQTLGINPLESNDLIFLQICIPFLQEKVKNLARINKTSVLQYIMSNQDEVMDIPKNEKDTSDLNENSNIKYSLLSNSSKSNEDVANVNDEAHKNLISEEYEQENNELVDEINEPVNEINEVSNEIEERFAPNGDHEVEEEIAIHEDHEVDEVTLQCSNQITNQNIDEQMKNIQRMLSSIGTMIFKAKHEISTFKYHAKTEMVPPPPPPTPVCPHKKSNAIAEIRVFANKTIEAFKLEAEEIIKKKILEIRKIQAIAEAKINSQFDNNIEFETNEGSASTYADICWNCGRIANETCSGCSQARYCSSFCQHKDWYSHQKNCGVHASYSF